MDYQQTFNTVIHALATQGRRANGEGSNMCYYRLPSNPQIKCGIGHLINDQDYIPEMELHTIEDLCAPMLDGHANPIPAYIRRDWSAHMHFLTDLQKIHDRAYTGHLLISGVELVAHTYNLVIEPELMNELQKVKLSWR